MASTVFTVKKKIYIYKWNYILTIYIPNIICKLKTQISTKMNILKNT